MKFIYILLLLLSAFCLKYAYDASSLELILSAIIFPIFLIALNFKKTWPMLIIITTCILSFLIAEPLFSKYSASLQSAIQPPPKFNPGGWKMTELGSQILVPGVHFVRRESLQGAEIYNVKYTIGTDGSRITPQYIESSHRINFLGCSVTFGEGLNDDETLPYFVAKNGFYSVKNYGFSGYGPHQVLALLKSNIDTFGDINFFLTGYFHIDRSACKQSWSKGPRYIFEDGKLKQDGFCQDLYDGTELKVWSKAEKILLSSAIIRASQKILYRASEENKDTRLYIELIKKMNEITRERGQRFMVGFIRGEPGYDKIIAELRKFQIDVIDLTLNDPKYVIPIDGHPTAIANQERANLILKKIGAAGGP